VPPAVLAARDDILHLTAEDTTRRYRLSRDARYPLALLLLAALLALPSARSMAQPPVDWSEEDRLATRQGPVILEKAEEANPPRWRITFNGKIAAETEFDALGLWEVFEGDDDRDHVIFRRASGGIACPYQFRVIETRPGGRVLVSEEFGSCLDPKRTRLYGRALVLDMPAHIPHPELLSASELRQRRQTTEIYTVRDGKVTVRHEIRR
jgi:hypothetical protein